MIKHFHKDEGDKTIWHDGALSTCPETEFDEILLEGKPARMARGMSVSLPPESDRKCYIISDVEIIRCKQESNGVSSDNASMRPARFT